MKRNIDTFLGRYLLPWIPMWVTPNHLTIRRMAMTFVAIACYGGGMTELAFALFVAAALSDYVDGCLARFRGQCTAWGKRADELADKLLVFGFLLTFFGSGVFTLSHESLLAWAVAIALLREIGISLARAYGLVQNVGVLFSARIKTTLQMGAVAILMLAHEDDAFYWVGTTLFIAATICALYSAWWYLVGTGSRVRQ